MLFDPLVTVKVVEVTFPHLTDKIWGWYQKAILQIKYMGITLAYSLLKK